MIPHPVIMFEVGRTLVWLHVHIEELLHVPTESVRPALWEAEHTNLATHKIWGRSGAVFASWGE